MKGDPRLVPHAGDAQVVFGADACVSESQGTAGCLLVHLYVICMSMYPSVCIYAGEMQFERFPLPGGNKIQRARSVVLYIAGQGLLSP